MTGQRLSNALVAAQPETVNLVVDGQTDLQTLEATDGDLATFSQGLASLTGQLRNSNGDVRALIRNSQSAEQQLNPFLAADSAHISRPRLEPGHRRPGVRPARTRTSKPSSSSSPSSPVTWRRWSGGGRVHGELDFNTADPVCPYIPGSLIPGPTQAVASPDLTNTCTGSAPGMLARGADSSPTFSGG